MAAVRRTYGKKASDTTDHLDPLVQAERHGSSMPNVNTHSLDPEAELLEQIDCRIYKRQRDENSGDPSEDDSRGNKQARAQITSASGLRASGKSAMLVQDIAYQLDGLVTGSGAVQRVSVRALLRLLQTPQARADALAHGLAQLLTGAADGMLRAASNSGGAAVGAQGEGVAFHSSNCGITGLHSLAELTMGKLDADAGIGIMVLLFLLMSTVMRADASPALHDALVAGDVSTGAPHHVEESTFLSSDQGARVREKPPQVSSMFDLFSPPILALVVAVLMQSNACLVVKDPGLAHVFRNVLAVDQSVGIAGTAARAISNKSKAGGVGESVAETAQRMLKEATGLTVKGNPAVGGARAGGSLPSPARASASSLPRYTSSQTLPLAPFDERSSDEENNATWPCKTDAPQAIRLTDAASGARLTIPRSLNGDVSASDLALYLLYRATAVRDAIEDGISTGNQSRTTGDLQQSVARQGRGDDGRDVVAVDAAVSEARERAVSSHMDSVRSSVRLSANGHGIMLLAVMMADAGRSMRDLAAEPPWPAPASALLTAVGKTGDIATLETLRAGFPARYALPLLRLRLLCQILEDITFLSEENTTALAACTLPGSLLSSSAQPTSRVTLIATLLGTVRAASVALSKVGTLQGTTDAPSCTGRMENPVLDAQTMCLRVLINLTNHYSPGCSACSGASLRSLGTDALSLPWAMVVRASGHQIALGSARLNVSTSARIATQSSHQVVVDDDSGAAWGLAAALEVIAVQGMQIRHPAGVYPLKKKRTDAKREGVQGGQPVPGRATGANAAAFDAVVTSLGLLANIAEHEAGAREALGRIAINMQAADISLTDMATVSTVLQALHWSEDVAEYKSSGLALLCTLFAVRFRRLGLHVFSDTGSAHSDGSAVGVEEFDSDDVVVGAYCALLLGCCCAIPGMARVQVLRVLGALLNNSEERTVAGAEAGSSISTMAAQRPHLIACSGLSVMLRAFVALQSAAGVLSEEAVGHVEAVQEVLDAIGAHGPSVSLTSDMAKASASLLVQSNRLGSQSLAEMEDMEYSVGAATPRGSPGRVSPALREFHASPTRIVGVGSLCAAAPVSMAARSPGREPAVGASSRPGTGMIRGAASPTKPGTPSSVFAKHMVRVLAEQRAETARQAALLDGQFQGSGYISRQSSLSELHEAPADSSSNWHGEASAPAAARTGHIGAPSRIVWDVDLDVSEGEGDEKGRESQDFTTGKAVAMSANIRPDQVQRRAYGRIQTPTASSQRSAGLLAMLLDDSD